MSSDERMLKKGTCERNKGFILQVFKQYINRDKKGLRMLEIASGTGQHAVYFASQFPNLEWQPSDVEEAHLASVRAHIKHHRSDNVLQPVHLDCSLPSEKWPALAQDERYNFMFTSNLTHITPFSVTEGLFKGAGHRLVSGGHLFIYGPFSHDGVITPESNMTFHEYLKDQDDGWGLRDVRELDDLAGGCGMERMAEHDMPSNNHVLVFTRK